MGWWVRWGWMGDVGGGVGGLCDLPLHYDMCLRDFLRKYIFAMSGVVQPYMFSQYHDLMPSYGDIRAIVADCGYHPRGYHHRRQYAGPLQICIALSSSRQDLRASLFISRYCLRLHCKYHYCIMVANISYRHRQQRHVDADDKGVLNQLRSDAFSRSQAHT